MSDLELQLKNFRVFVVSIGALLPASNEIADGISFTSQHWAYITEAPNSEQAAVQAQVFALEEFPIADGWYRHSASISLFENREITDRDFVIFNFQDQTAPINMLDGDIH